MSPKAWVDRQFRRKARVYILPTKMGGYLIGLIFLMFLLSVGYNNNLLLIFTLFLFTFNLMWLVQTNFHLHRLKLEGIQVADGHAGESRPVIINWKSSPDGHLEWTLTLEADQTRIPLPPGDHHFQRSVASLLVPSRGAWTWKHLKVESVRPYGLYRAWKYFKVQAQSYSYPALSEGAPLLFNGGSKEGEIPQDCPGHEDIRQFLRYEGNETRPISWKHYAKSGELMVREGEEFAHDVAHLSLQLPGPDKEAYLSVLATQMRQCHRLQIPFTFEAKGRVFGPAYHQEHLHECLRVLALC